MTVDRCICKAVPFTELKRLAAAHALDAEALKDRTGCGRQCGLCGPYIDVVLATGVTHLPVMSPQECARIVRMHSGSSDEA